MKFTVTFIWMLVGVFVAIGAPTKDSKSANSSPTVHFRKFTTKATVHRNGDNLDSISSSRNKNSKYEVQKSPSVSSASLSSVGSLGSLQSLKDSNFAKSVDKKTLHCNGAVAGTKGSLPCCPDESRSSKSPTYAEKKKRSFTDFMFNAACCLCTH